MVCIDISPNRTSQAKERSDILNVGGFTDDVFKLVSRFASGEMDDGHWVQDIENIRI
jgi:60 kDa SS-A/Ro ribonucleoprotein